MYEWCFLIGWQNAVNWVPSDEALDTPIKLPGSKCDAAAVSAGTSVLIHTTFLSPYQGSLSLGKHFRGPRRIYGSPNLKIIIYNKG